MRDAEWRRRRALEIKGKMTNAQLAKKLGVTDSYVTRMLWKSGKKGGKGIGEKTVARFEQSFGKPPGWFDKIGQFADPSEDKAKPIELSAFDRELLEFGHHLQTLPETDEVVSWRDFLAAMMRAAKRRANGLPASGRGEPPALRSAKRERK